LEEDVSSGSGKVEEEADVEDGNRVEEEDEDDDDEYRDNIKQPHWQDEEEVRTSSQKRRTYIDETQATPNRNGAVSSYEILKKKYQFNGSAARGAAV
jgi:hypothetical protein